MHPPGDRADGADRNADDFDGLGDLVEVVPV
jgi:hypothetical protein